MTILFYIITGSLLVCVAVLYYQKRCLVKKMSHFGRFFVHEINGVLYASRTGVEVLLKLMAGQPGTDREVLIAENMLSKTDAAFESVAALKNVMLEPARVNRDVIVDSVDLRHSLHRVLSSFDGIFRASAIDIQANIDPMTAKAILDHDFKLIATQLIRNAVQAVIVGGEEGGKKIAVRLFFQDAPEKHIVLAVSDNGVGMNAAVKRKCLRFGFSSHEQFRGMGLTIVTYTLKMYGATLRIQSQKGAGSTFRVAIPVQ